MYFRLVRGVASCSTAAQCRLFKDDLRRPGSRLVETDVSLGRTKLRAGREFEHQRFNFSVHA